MDIGRSLLFFIVVSIYCVRQGVDSQENSLVVTAENVTAVRRTSPSLRCRYNITEAIEKITVKWYKDELWMSTAEYRPGSQYTYITYNDSFKEKVDIDQNLQHLASEHFITLINVQLEDEGQYFCLVMFWKTPTGTNQGQSGYITLTVIVPPKPSLIVPHNGKIPEGKEIQMTCESPQANPATEAFEITNGSRSIDCIMSDNNTDLGYCLITLRPWDNGAEWYCRAVWNGDSYFSPKKTLDISFPASKLTLTPSTSAVAPGGQLNITCKTDSANPTPDISWEKDSVAISNDETYNIAASEEGWEFKAHYRISTLSFTAMPEHDGNKFACAVIGQVGFRSSHIVILDISPSSPTTEPTTPERLAPERLRVTSGSPNTARIAGITAGLVVFLILIVVIIVVLMKRRKRNSSTAMYQGFGGDGGAQEQKTPQTEAADTEGPL